MGCDIHGFGEKRVGNRWEAIPNVNPFDWRSYGLFAFLAGVRNYSAVTPIAERRGLPPDISQPVREDSDGWDMDGHSHSYLTMAELEAFDYDQPMEDRRVTIGGDGGCTAKPGGGRMTTYREFLGSGYFKELARFKALGVERLVFWFDN